jgi:hypothetical protein
MKKFMIGAVFLVVVVWAWTMLFAENKADVLDQDWSQAKWEYFVGDCSITFGDPQTGSMVGALSWCKGKVEFQGNVDESAKLFFEYAWKKLIYPHWDEFVTCRERSEK